MLLTKFVEVPNTNIKEEVLSDFGLISATIWHSNTDTLS